MIDYSKKFIKAPKNLLAPKNSTNFIEPQPMMNIIYIGLKLSNRSLRKGVQGGGGGVVEKETMSRPKLWIVFSTENKTN